MFLFHKSQTKREAFGQMFTEMYPRMVRYATQLMGDREEARDIVSEVMEQAWKHFEQLNKNDRGGWIYTAVRNNCLNRLKHLQVEQENVKALYEATLADVENNYREHEALLQKAEAIARSLDFLDHAAQHQLRSVEIGDHAVLQRTDRLDVRIGLLVHLAGLRTDSHQFTGVYVQRHDGRLVHHDLPVVNNQSIGRTQVDSQLLCQ